MGEEEWLPIEGHIDYQISDLGRVRSFKNKSKGKILSQRINLKTGYYYLNLCENGKYKSCQVHLLVAKNFVPWFHKDLMTNHKDGNKLNNLPSNLEWTTSSGNVQHAFDMGLNKGRKGSDCNLTKLREKDILIIRRLRERGWTHKKISALYKVSRGTITQILSGTIWSHIQ